MEQEALNFLEKERVANLRVLLSDGSPHGSAVHYSLRENPLAIFIQTSRSTLKVQPFLQGQSGKASMVVGFSEDDWLTLQMRGNVRVVSDEEELKEVYKVFYKKNPDAEQYKGPNTVFLEFTPMWWRYSDFNTDPETIIMSDAA